MTVIKFNSSNRRGLYTLISDSPLLLVFFGLIRSDIFLRDLARGRKEQHVLSNRLLLIGSSPVNEDVL